MRPKEVLDMSEEERAFVAAAIKIEAEEIKKSLKENK